MSSCCGVTVSDVEDFAGGDGFRCFVFVGDVRFRRVDLVPLWVFRPPFFFSDDTFRLLLLLPGVDDALRSLVVEELCSNSSC